LTVSLPEELNRRGKSTTKKSTYYLNSPTLGIRGGGLLSKKHKEIVGRCSDTVHINKSAPGGIVLQMDGQTDSRHMERQTEVYSTA